MTHIPEVLPSKRLAFKRLPPGTPSPPGPQKCWGAVGLGHNRFTALSKILSTLRDDSQVFKTGAAGAQISQVFSPFSGQKLVSNMHYFSSHGGVLCLLPNGILEGVA